MKLQKTIVALVLLTSPFANSANFIRLENAINIDAFKLETRVNMSEGVDGIVSLDSNKETAGLEYNLALAYAKYTKAFSKQLVAEFDLGIAYETTGESYKTYAAALGISDDFQDSAGSVWGAATLNYIIAPNLITNIDLSATHDIYNETVLGMYRSRASVIYQPIDNLNLIYRTGLTYVQNGITSELVKAGELVSDDYLISHEFYIGYAGESGLEPYVMLKDMENNSHYDVSVGFYYRFK
jgi:hypothetical protein